MVYELLGILLGEVVEEAAAGCHRAYRFRLQPVANRFGLLLHGHVYLHC